MKYGAWFNVRRCVNCKESLYDGEVIYSRGRCPKCGHKAPGAGTIVSVTEHAARKVWPVWWKFWSYEIEVR